MEGFGHEMNAFGGGYEMEGGNYGTGSFFGTGTVDEISGSGSLSEFGGGGYLVEAGERAQAGAAYDRSGSRNTFIPMKIGHLFRSWLFGPQMSTVTPFYKPASVPLNPSLPHPPPVPQIHLLRIVGIIRKIDKGADSEAWDLGDGGMERISLSIEDGTGCIDCQMVIPEDLSPWKKNSLKALLIPNRYVKVYGSVVLLGQRYPHIHVHALRELSSCDDIFFHDSDCMYTAVLYKYGPGNDDINKAS